MTKIKRKNAKKCGANDKFETWKFYLNKDKTEENMKEKTRENEFKHTSANPPVITSIDKKVRV